MAKVPRKRSLPIETPQEQAERELFRLVEDNDPTFVEHRRLHKIPFTVTRQRRNGKGMESLVQAALWAVMLGQSPHHWSDSLGTVKRLLSKKAVQQSLDDRTLMLAWMVSGVVTDPRKLDVGFQAWTEQRLYQRFQWDQPGGFERFAQSLVDMAPSWNTEGEQRHMTRNRNPFFMLMGLSLVRAMNLPKVLLKAVETQHPDALPPIADRRWYRSLNAKGHALGWAWANAMVEAALPAFEKPPASRGLEDVPLDIVRGLAAGDWNAGVSNILDVRKNPMIPFDAMAVHTVLGALVHRDSKASVSDERKKSSMPILDAVFQRMLHDKIPMDVTLPGFEQRVSQVVKGKPDLDLQVQSFILNAAMDQVLPNEGTALEVARPRARL